MTTLERIYPNCKIVGLDQMLVDGSKWYDTLIFDPADIVAIARRGTDSAGRKIRMMALVLEDREGFRCIADFRPDEIV